MGEQGRGALSHSHSQPGGMDRTPPGTPRKGGKMLAVRVQMLDDSVTLFQVQVCLFLYYSWFNSIRARQIEALHNKTGFPYLQRFFTLNLTIFI